MMFRRYFTLVELLTVIAIIAILAAIAIPASIGMYRRAYITRAANDIAALKIALESYMTSYNGSLPFGLASDETAYYLISSGNPSGQGVVSPGYANFMKVMAGSVTDTNNPRKIEFIKARENEGEAWLDPWENPYVILFVPAGKREITIGGNKHYGKFFIASWGPNWKELTKNLGSSPDELVNEIFKDPSSTIKSW